MFQIPLDLKRFLSPEVKSPILQLLLRSDAARVLIIRGKTPNGIIQAQVTTGATRAEETFNISLPEIPLSLHITSTTTAIQRGRLYITAYLSIGGVIVGTFFSDYLSDTYSLSWPPGVFKSLQHPPGFKRAVSVTPPAVGTNLTQTVPTNASWLVQSLALTLITDANVATRTVRIRHTNSAGNVLHHFVPSTTQAENLTRAYQFAQYNNVPATFLSTICGELVPFFALAGDIIDTVITNIQAGDEITAPFIKIEEWIYP